MSDMGGGMPMIRIELEGMRQQILYSLGVRNVEIQKALDESLATAISSYDLAAGVREQVKGVVQEQLTRAMESAVREIFRDPEVKKVVRAAILRALAEDPPR